MQGLSVPAAIPGPTGANAKLGTMPGRGFGGPPPERIAGADGDGRRGVRAISGLIGETISGVMMYLLLFLFCSNRTIIYLRKRDHARTRQSPRRISLNICIGTPGTPSSFEMSCLGKGSSSSCS